MRGKLAEGKGDPGGIKTYRTGKMLMVDPTKFLNFSDFNRTAGPANIEEDQLHIGSGLESDGERTVPCVVTDHLNGDEARRKDPKGFRDRVLLGVKSLRGK